MKMEELKKKVLEIEKQFQMEVSKELREILFLESKLLETGIDREFKRDLGLLAEGDPLVGNHKFKRSDYQLAWEKGENGVFHLSLLNKILGRKLPLKKCPPVFFQEIVGLLPQFIQELHLEISKEK